MNYDTTVEFEEVVEKVAKGLEVDESDFRRSIAGVGLLVFSLVMAGEFDITIGEIPTAGIETYHQHMAEIMKCGFGGGEGHA